MIKINAFVFLLLSTITALLYAPIDPVATHIQPLTTAVLKTKTGPILELGCGHYSTPLLHVLCQESNRKLISVDSSKPWLNVFRDLERPWHQFIYVPAQEAGVKAWDAIGNDEHWSVVFVDHDPAKRRVIDLHRLRAQVDVFVVHDTENITGYNWEPTLSSFKYRYDFYGYTRKTTLVSDFIDVREFFDE